MWSSVIKRLGHLVRGDRAAAASSAGMGFEAQLRKANQDLEKNRRFLDSMVENLPNMVFVKDARDLRFVRFNRAGAELLGIRAEDLIGKNDYDLFPPEQADFFTSKDRAVLAGHSIVDIPEERIRTPRGERVLHTRKIPILSADGHPEYLLGISEDVTDARAAEAVRLETTREQAALVERERAAQRTSFLAEASTCLASSFDSGEALLLLARLATRAFADGCVVSLRRDGDGFETVAMALRGVECGVGSENSVERSMAALASDPGGLRAPIDRGCPVIVPDVGSVEFSADLAVTGLDPDTIARLRSLGCASILAVPIVGRDRTHGAIFFLSWNLDRRFGADDATIGEELGRRAASALENQALYASAQAAIRARDEFLSIASHELKTPLTSLKLQLQIARRSTRPETGESPSPEKLARILDLSGTQVSRLVALIDDLLDVSRIESGKLTFEYDAVDLRELVLDMVERYREHLAAAGCAVSVRLPDPEAGDLAFTVRADRFRLEQVVLNLISNAAKYGDAQPVELSVARSANGVVLSCRDRGLGIPPSKLEKVFERFERVGSDRHIGGLGLGLYISSEIVRAHDGTIRVESTLGAGSDFIVELPAWRGSAELRSTLSH